MSALVSRIKSISKEKGISLSFLCSKMGVARVYFNDIEKQNRAIPHDKLEIIADVLNVSVDYILGNTDTPVRRQGVKIPVLGNVAAGIPIEAITEIEDYEEITEDMAAKGEYVALTIHGDSMEPRMLEGDVVIVRLQDTIESGETAIVIVNGGEATCKRIKKSPEGITLVAFNPDYEPVFYSNQQIEQLPVRIFGKVVELRGKFK